MIKKSIQRHHVCHFCIAFKGCDFWLLTPSAFFFFFLHLSRVPIWRMVIVISWYLMPEILLSSLQLRFAQCYTWVMKINAKKKKKKKKNGKYILHSILIEMLCLSWLGTYVRKSTYEYFMKHFHVNILYALWMGCYSQVTHGRPCTKICDGFMSL